MLSKEKRNKASVIVKEIGKEEIKIKIKTKDGK